MGLCRLSDRVIYIYYGVVTKREWTKLVKTKNATTKDKRIQLNPLFLPCFLCWLAFQPKKKDSGDKAQTIKATF